MLGHSKYSLFVAVLLAVAFTAGPAEGARVKDIAFIDGVRPNQLVGYGIVVGLSGTGDKSSATYTVQSITNMFNKFGMKLDADDISVKNVATVIVTAELPPFAGSGSTLDVLVSSVGDAKSLMGGTLISTPLKGADGSVYAVAQGPISLGGFLAGGDGASVTKNHQTAAIITGGAIVERDLPIDLLSREELFLTLRSPDFTTAKSMARSINRTFASGVAVPLSPGKIRVNVPTGIDNVIDFISEIERLNVETDAISKVVINERTGTIVMGENVTISKVAVSHGDISIEVSTEVGVSQPAPFSEGETVVIPTDEITVEEERSSLVVLPESVTLGDVVKALNLVGVTPRELVAILQAMKAAGALQAELQII